MTGMPRLPTPKQAEISKLLQPILRLKALPPWGTFSKIARQAEVTPSYVVRIFNELRLGGQQ